MKLFYFEYHILHTVTKYKLLPQDVIELQTTQLFYTILSQSGDTRTHSNSHALLCLSTGSAWKVIKLIFSCSNKATEDDFICEPGSGGS